MSVFEAEQAAEGGSEFRAIWSGLAEQFLGPVMILAAVQASEADTANGVGCGDPGKNGDAGGGIEVLAVVAPFKHQPGYLKVRLGRPQARPRFGGTAW